jgi:hypothetical protein
MSESEARPFSETLAFAEGEARPASDPLLPAKTPTKAVTSSKTITLADVSKMLHASELIAPGKSLLKPVSYASLPSVSATPYPGPPMATRRARLYTACGCTKEINIPGPAPEIHMPISTPSGGVTTRRFRYVTKEPDGTLAYREQLESTAGTGVRGKASASLEGESPLSTERAGRAAGGGSSRAKGIPEELLKALREQELTRMGASVFTPDDPYDASKSGPRFLRKGAS